ncbi:MAG: flavoprotein [Candidatus Anammoxibacter sp.]
MSKNVILGVSGSIAAYKSLQIVTDLRRLKIEVVVVMTGCAQRFITPLSFKALSQKEVITDLFEENSVRDPLHVALSNNVDLVVIAPATANVIGKIAGGISDDALTCTVMASTATKIIVPAMEGRMYNNPIVQGNIKKLQALGYKFIGPVKGRLASGSEDMGRMSEVDEVVREITKELGMENKGVSV